MVSRNEHLSRRAKSIAEAIEKQQLALVEASFEKRDKQEAEMLLTNPSRVEQYYSVKVELPIPMVSSIRTQLKNKGWNVKQECKGGIYIYTITY